MIITCEINLRNFEGWSGAKDTLSALTTQQLDTLENLLEDVLLYHVFFSSTREKF